MHFYVNKTNMVMLCIFGGLKLCYVKSAFDGYLSFWFGPRRKYMAFVAWVALS